MQNHWVVTHENLPVRALIALDRIGLARAPPWARPLASRVFDAASRPPGMTDDEWNYIKGMAKGGGGFFVDLWDGTTKLADWLYAASIDYDGPNMLQRVLDHRAGTRPTDHDLKAFFRVLAGGAC